MLFLVVDVPNEQCCSFGIDEQCCSVVVDKGVDDVGFCFISASNSMELGDLCQ